MQTSQISVKFLNSQHSCIEAGLLKHSAVRGYSVSVTTVMCPFCPCLHLSGSKYRICLGKFLKIKVSYDELFTRTLTHSFFSLLIQCCHCNNTPVLPCVLWNHKGCPVSSRFIAAMQAPILWTLSRWPLWTAHFVIFYKVRDLSKRSTKCYMKLLNVLAVLEIHGCHYKCSTNSIYFKTNHLFQKSTVVLEWQGELRHGERLATFKLLSQQSSVPKENGLVFIFNMIFAFLIYFWLH